jgi:hypothetical protein
LPERYEWPRTSGGTPLHFLAQVDCADIRFKTALPERGVLFFFGRDDDEQIWNEQPPASDDCRVLYALDAFALTPPRQPPADLPPIRGGGSTAAVYDYGIGDGTGLNVHTAWPIVPLRFDSFPDASALPEIYEWSLRNIFNAMRGVPAARQGMKRDTEIRDAYGTALKARRVAAIEAATGAPPPQGEGTGPEYRRRAGTAILAPGPQSFPQHWAYVHYLARVFLQNPAGFTHHRGAELGRVTAEAERWLARSREVPLVEPVADGDRDALRAWLVCLKSLHDPSELGYNGTQLAFLAAVATIRTWAGDPALAALVPDSIYAACEGYFYGYHEHDPQFSQMLGHAPSAQDALPADDPMICLLNLDTSMALGWSFGDGGQCTFWITPGDLARRDFSKVEGTIVGH